MQTRTQMMISVERLQNTEFLVDLFINYNAFLGIVTFIISHCFTYFIHYNSNHYWFSSHVCVGACELTYFNITMVYNFVYYIFNNDCIYFIICILKKETMFQKRSCSVISLTNLYLLYNQFYIFVKIIFC